jgi:hypothetical protein
MEKQTKTVVKRANNKAKAMDIEKLEDVCIKLCYELHYIRNMDGEENNEKTKKIEEYRTEIETMKKEANNINKMLFFATISMGVSITTNDEEEKYQQEFHTMNPIVQNKIIKKLFHLISKLNENEIDDILQTLPNDTVKIFQTKHNIEKNDEEDIEEYSGIIIILDTNLIAEDAINKFNTISNTEFNNSIIDLTREEHLKLDCTTVFIYSATTFVLDLSDTKEKKTVKKKILVKKTKVDNEETLQNDALSKTEEKLTTNEDVDVDKTTETKIRISGMPNGKKCSICREEGHNKSKCPKKDAEEPNKLTKNNLKAKAEQKEQKSNVENETKSTTSSNRSVHCGNCGELGHNKRTCKTEEKSICEEITQPAKKERKCSNCGNTGHNKLKCPNPPKN